MLVRKAYEDEPLLYFFVARKAEGDLCEDSYTPEDLLALYSFTGGVAKYVQLLVDAGAMTKSTMLDHIIKADSIFLGEGKAILIEEFGKDYGVYFSILSAIARGKTSRSEIESVVGREIGGYLTKLENDYEVIAKKQPLFEKSSTKNVRYTIEDNFFTFWFRFIYKYSYMLEIENYDSLKTIINRDYETFSGLMLERYFRRVLIERKIFTRIGGWWIWLYANAILTERLEGGQQAKKILADGMKHCASSSSLVKESVYIYKKYLDACTMKYFSEIEWLTFFKWLDDKIVANKRNLDWYYLHYLENNHSFCYYNDMMRKIVYAGLIPRLLEMKEGGLALLLANYADNRLLKLNKARETGVLNIPKGEFNPYDYSNESFRLLNTLPVDDLNKYRKLLVFKKWEGELVNFLYDKSYVNLEYLDDIIGTRYLREMNYQSACQYFKVVSNDYQERMNVASYMNRDPFTVECENKCAKTSDSVRYKLRFAEKMCKLEEQMKSDDKIEREKAACLYYWGIYNSHFSCWALTRYRDEIWRSNVSPAIKKLCIENVQLIAQNSYDAEVKAQCHWILACISRAESYSDWRYHIGMLHQYDAIVKEVKEWTAHCDSYKMYEEN